MFTFDLKIREGNPIPALPPFARTAMRPCKNPCTLVKFGARTDLCAYIQLNTAREGLREEQSFETQPKKNTA